MNICVTGACGHIGSALIRDLSVPDVEKIYLVDNLLTQRYASLFDLPEGGAYQFCEIDILDDAMENIIKDSDVCIHLAAVTDAETSFHKTEEVDRVNKGGIERIATLCAANNCSLIFPSTTSVYGVQEGVVDENCSKEDLKPQSPYAESKLYAEEYLKSQAEQAGLEFVVLRLGTIFGYSIGMRFHTAVNKFMWQASKGENISVWKTALHQKRPYCDLTDAINAVKFVIEDNVFDGGTYNIATVNLTVNDIVKAIKEVIPDLIMDFVDSPIMNQLSYEVSVEKSLQRGFKYSGDLNLRVGETLQILKNIHSAHKKAEI